MRVAGLTSGIVNSVHGHLVGTGGSSTGFAGMQLGVKPMMQLGSGSMMHLASTNISPSASNHKGGLWAQTFGGLSREDAIDDCWRLG